MLLKELIEYWSSITEEFSEDIRLRGISNKLRPVCSDGQKMQSHVERLNSSTRTGSDPGLVHNLYGTLSQIDHGYHFLPHKFCFFSAGWRRHYNFPTFANQWHTFYLWSPRTWWNYWLVFNACHVKLLLVVFFKT